MTRVTVHIGSKGLRGATGAATTHYWTVSCLSWASAPSDGIRPVSPRTVLLVLSVRRLGDQELGGDSR